MKPLHCLLAAGILALAAACHSGGTATADYRVVPLPDSIADQPGAPFKLDGSTVIVCADTALATEARLLHDYLSTLTGLDLAVTDRPRAGGAITLCTCQPADTCVSPEGYTLTVHPDSGVCVCGNSPAGAFYGVQTLRKSIGHCAASGAKCVELPCVCIKDTPRFAFRGAMLDACRYYFSPDDVKRFIDIMALHNLNTFHWHLNDDQGWRLEILSRPELVAKGSVRSETVIGHNTPEYDGTPHGGHYTQAQAREIVRYAADRHIQVIPEIDMPGHMQAALAAYPHLGCTGGPYEVWKIFGVSNEVLCAGNDSTYRFIDDVLGELTDIFPSPVIHIGGDECPKLRWEACPKCQAKIKALGLKADAEHTAEMKLQSHLIGYAEDFLAARGRRIIGWDEILEGGLTPGAAVMSWRGTEGGLKAASMGHDVVMSPSSHCYIDFYQSPHTESEPDAIGGLVTVEQLYGYEPVPDTLDPSLAHHILGAQANLWTTYIPDMPLAEYMTLPRLAALAEVTWCDSSHRDIRRFAASTHRLTGVYDAEGYRYATHLFDIKPTVTPCRERGVMTVALDTWLGTPVHYTLDGTVPTEQSPLYTGPFDIDSACTVSARTYGVGYTSPVFTEHINFHKGALKPVRLLTQPSPKCTYGGADALTDALTGSPVMESGRWVGWYGTDFDAVVDLGADTEISQVSLNACVVKYKWVFDMRALQVSASADGKDYTLLAAAEYPKITAGSLSGVYPHTLSFDPVKARYVRVKATCETRPEGYDEHGVGYLYVDEIVIN